jgi:hypothetical protein
MPSAMVRSVQNSSAFTPVPAQNHIRQPGIQIITKTKLYRFFQSPSIAPRVALSQESRITCTFSLLCGGRVVVIIYMRRSIAHTREDTQGYDFLSKKNLRLVTVPKIQSSRLELLRLRIDRSRQVWRSCARVSTAFVASQEFQCTKLWRPSLERAYRICCEPSSLTPH